MPYKFGIVQNRPVESMGKYDIYAPIQTAQARAKAVETITGTLEQWVNAEKEKDISGAVADYKKKTTELRMRLENTRMIDLNQYPGLEFSDDVRRTAKEVKDEKTGQTQLVVPTWKVIEQIYDNEEQKIRETATKSFSKDMVSSFYSETGDYAARTTNAIVGKAYKDRGNDLRVSYEMAFDKHIKNMDLPAAMKTADKAYLNGAWDSDLYQTKTENAAEDVESTQIEVAITVSDDPKALDMIVNNIADRVSTGNTAMQDLTAAKFIKMADDKAEKIRKQRKDDYEKAKKDRSSRALIEHLKAIRSRQEGAYSDDEIVLIAEGGGLEKADLNSLIVANNSYKDRKRNEEIESKPGARERARRLINSLNYPVPDQERNIQKRNIERVLAIMAGIDINDPTKEIDRDPELSQKDYGDFLTELEDAYARPLKDPDFKDFVDNVIYASLVGASKATYAGGQTPANYLNAANAERELRKEVLKFGPGFDYDQWWSKNYLKYATKNLENNKRSLERKLLKNQSLSQFQKNDGTFNVDDASVFLIKQKNEGLRTDEEIDTILDDMTRVNNDSRVVEDARRAYQ